jgi:hypothetical protein
MALPPRLRLALPAVIVFAAASVIQGQSTTPDPATQQQAADQNQPAPKTKHPGPACLPLSAAVSDGTPGQTAPSPPGQINQDVCIQAHVYDVVELTDGTRFLDVCAADIPDEQCRFTILSLPSDREEVGDLRRYRNQNIQLRGTLRSMRGRFGIILSHARQFNGGPEKFRPNPRLLRDFNGQSDRMPIHDPNLARTGHHRSFMNTHDQETLPTTRH